MNELFVSLGLVAIFEGFLPLLMPNRYRRYLIQLLTVSPAQLRFFGGALMVVGALTLLWVGQR